MVGGGGGNGVRAPGVYICDLFSQDEPNLNTGNLRYIHVSNLQVLFVIFILKSCFCSKKCGRDALL